jgi:phosphoenolpyruvate carboxylase
LSKKILAKLIKYNNAKKLWDKLETIYAGDSKVKRAKLQTLKVQYEGLKMKDEENISEYFEIVDNIVNAIRGLGV